MIHLRCIHFTVSEFYQKKVNSFLSVCLNVWTCYNDCYWQGTDLSDGLPSSLNTIGRCVLLGACYCICYHFFALNHVKSPSHKQVIWGPKIPSAMWSDAGDWLPRMVLSHDFIICLLSYCLVIVSYLQNYCGRNVVLSSGSHLQCNWSCLQWLTFFFFERLIHKRKQPCPVCPPRAKQGPR